MKTLWPFLIGIATSVIAAFILELFGIIKFSITLRERLFKRLNIRNFFSMSGDVQVVLSIPKKGVTRDSDHFVYENLKGYIKKNNKSLNAKYSLEYPITNLIIIGSPRYNETAEEIQKFFETSYEFIFDSYDPDPAKKILKIVNKYGDEFSSSKDLKLKREGDSIDYGVLFVANLENSKRLIWIAGIHGAGTIGVFQHLLKNSKKFLVESRNLEKNTGKIWLFRIWYEENNYHDDFSSIRKVELLGEGYKCNKRKIFEQPKVLICDFGNVIMFFDRDRTYRAIGHHLNMDYIEVKDKIQESKIRVPYENGDFDSKVFYEKLTEIFPGLNKISYKLFREIYGDIFWLNNNMVKALKLIKEKGLINLMLLSNTNEIHFSTVRNHYKDVIALFDDNLALSYELKASKPKRIAYEEALTRFSPDLKFPECIFIDDKEDNIIAARKLGIEKCIHFYSYTQFISSMRKFGVYIP